MIGHLLVPALDDKSPATLSRSIVDGLLRKKLGYDGLIMTDDLGMKAVAATHPIDELAVSAVGAGCDLLLLCPPNYDEQANALESLIHAVESNILSIPEIRANLPKFSNWPTFAQLYVVGDLVGGSDILVEMHENGELQKLIDTIESET